MAVNPTPLQHPITQDIPLPGHYPCLTTQLNLTSYQSARQGRWVIVTREPSLSIEVKRSFLDVAPYDESRRQMLGAFSQHLLDVQYLMGWTD